MREGKQTPYRTCASHSFLGVASAFVVDRPKEEECTRAQWGGNEGRTMVVKRTPALRTCQHDIGIHMYACGSNQERPCQNNTVGGRWFP